MPPDALPAYEPHLAAFHRAFARHLRRIVRAVPAPPAARVLDVACGDGFYTALWARRLGPAGAVVAADLSPAYLRVTRAAVRKAARRRPLAAVEYAEADAYRLPFPDASFDLAWCAQSLITLDDGVRALAEMRRVVRPGGAVAVLESDEYHHVLLNWPVGTELAVQRAVADACRAKYGTQLKLSPARRLRKRMAEAGLGRVQRKTFAADRAAPFDRRTADFLSHHFAQTKKLIAGRLPADQQAAVDRFTDPSHPEAFVRRPDAELTCVDTLFVAAR